MRDAYSMSFFYYYVQLFRWLFIPPKIPEFRKCHDFFGIDSENILTFLELVGKLTRNKHLLIIVIQSEVKDLERCIYVEFIYLNCLFMALEKLKIADLWR